MRPIDRPSATAVEAVVSGEPGRTLAQHDTRPLARGDLGYGQARGHETLLRCFHVAAVGELYQRRGRHLGGPRREDALAGVDHEYSLVGAVGAEPALTRTAARAGRRGVRRAGRG